MNFYSHLPHSESHSRNQDATASDSFVSRLDASFEPPKGCIKIPTIHWPPRSKWIHTGNIATTICKRMSRHGNAAVGIMVDDGVINGSAVWGIKLGSDEQACAPCARSIRVFNSQYENLSKPERKIETRVLLSFSSSHHLNCYEIILYQSRPTVSFKTYMSYNIH